MSNSEFIKHLITEQLFLIPEDESLDKTTQAEHQDVTAPDNSSLDDNLTKEVEVPLLIVTKIANNSERELLSKVLSAIGFQMEQVGLAEPSTDHHFTAKRVLTFTDEEASCYSVSSDEKGTEKLFSRSLSTLSQSIEDKKSLWVALKNWFEV